MLGGRTGRFQLGQDDIKDARPKLLVALVMDLSV